MKAALVLTGLLRNWEHAYPSFKKYFLDRYDCDVFIDIWSEVGFYDGRNYLPEQNGFIRVKEGDKGFHANGRLVDANKLMEVYRPRALRIEDYANTFEKEAEEKAKQLVNAYTRPKNTISQAYKMWCGIMTMLSSSNVEYDLIIRARPDITLESDPGELNPAHFYTLPSRNKMGKGTGDSIQIGNQGDMTRFVNSHFFHIQSYYDELGVSCPHLFVEKAIQAHEFDWYEMHVGAHVAHSESGRPYEEPTDGIKI
jgi:hypothetical protein